MKRMTTLALALTIAGMVFSPVQPAAAATFEYFYTFNETIDPFQPIADSPALIDAATLTVSHECYGGDGLDNGCARLVNAHGAAFVPLMAQQKGEGFSVKVEFIARDLGNCGRCAIIVYSGNGKPQGIGSFEKVGPVLSAQWQIYTYQLLFTSGSQVVAVGIMNLDSTKDKQVAGIDNLRVTIQHN